MNKRITYIRCICFIATFIFYTLLIPAYLFAQSENKTVPLIELKGNDHERGLQHGKQLKKEIAEVYAKWKENMKASLNADPDSTIAAFLKATDFEPITRKYIPGILDELHGIAEGSGQKFSDVFAFQLVDEFWIYLDKQFNTNKHHCSGVGVPATNNHPAYIAQNVDLESYMNGYQVLLHIPPGKNMPEQYIVSCAGLVALSGMNDKGIGLCLNSLMELQASTDGLPVAFIIRAVLNKKNGNEALSFLQNVKHASGQNYIVGIADSVYDFEASANKVIRFFTNKNNSVVYHTNHALVNHDVKDWYKSYHEKVLTGETKNRNSEVRFASLEDRFNKQPSDISTDLIKTTLRSKDDERNPVCRAYRGTRYGFTFSSVVYTLGGKRSVQLTYGSPDQSEYNEYFFEF
ncbi:MAG: C45 family autoproteolytic acyltransferase/hydrolase [Ferruginibacter sp.]